MTLTDFLYARIAEDDDEAGETTPRFPWKPTYVGTNNRLEYTHDGLMIAPERIHDEGKAKRELVQMLSPDLGNNQMFDPLPHQVRALQWLAYPYAEHPDYDESWRP